MSQLPFARWQRRRGGAGPSPGKRIGLAGHGHRYPVEPYRFDDGTCVERSLAWPQLKSDEVAHLMAFFERATRSER